ncbi:hypothetical protein [Mycolicibacterium mageritense]|uniref:hypothetical protein n=1 Tax=Mycolicibacterium mageritense TaxID=53462 RepID=UPI0011DBB9E2|nr:hypothetical protein [Mycolicibacterium mageritense]TXI56242.1 MAG: hypothetical protein E6Q55_29615 [Mycolicibacterium mageritense]
MSRRVIFPDPDIWTHKEHHMTNQPAAVHRRLTDAERQLMAHLASAVLAQQTGVSIEAAAEALQTYKGEMHLTGDAYDCYLTLDGHVLVHVTREFLAFFASHPDEVIDLGKYCTTYKPQEGEQ